MNKFKLTAIAIATSATMFVGSAMAHDPGNAGPGTPTCIEANIMMADAMNAPFSNIPGAGRVIEMNTTTGLRGITVNNSMTAANAGGPLCPPHMSCPGPFKPTGIVSGGEDGHAYLTSAAQHGLIEHHRDGTPIRTSPVWPTSPSPNGGNFGFVPRLLGNGFMPNGNIAQAVCDANFFNAANSDSVSPLGNTHVSGNASNLFFPPVYGTAARADNGRVIVIDQNTLEVVDEYSRPSKGPFKNDPRWNCPAGVIFTSEGMFVSMFHGDAVFVIDWVAGINDDHSEGVYRNDPSGFHLDKNKNESEVIRVIDLYDTVGGDSAPDQPTGYDSGNRRDNLRAIRMAENGTLYGTRRSRSLPCNEGDPGCNPGVFRQHVFVVDPGSDHINGTIALDPGVNIIAGMTINRMSGPGCAFVEAEELANTGSNSGDACDVETLWVGVSAGNAGCDPDGDGINGPGHLANQCFRPAGTGDGKSGGTLYEYRIDAAHIDGGNGKPCTGDPADSFGAGGGNEGCALPIAQFDFLDAGGNIESLDPRMVMAIHEAFTQ